MKKIIGVLACTLTIQAAAELRVEMSPSKTITLTWNSEEGVTYRVLRSATVYFTNAISVTNVISDTGTATIKVPATSQQMYYQYEERRNPLFGKQFYVEPNSNAARQAVLWAVTNQPGSARMLRLSQEPQGIWLASSSSPNTALRVSSAAKLTGTMPIMPAYYIPNRDCNGFSEGGAPDAETYLRWCTNVWKNFATQTLVLLEPDALGHMELRCLTLEQQATRYSLLRQARHIFHQEGRALVYLDGTHPKWLSTNEMARRLILAGIDKADGFFVNVSNFQTTEDCIAYGTAVSKLVGDKHFIIDVGRNGKGQTVSEKVDNFWWSNPPGAGAGRPTRTKTGHPLVDMEGWFKPLGQSDGPYPKGAPGTGQWYPAYADELMINGGY